VTIGQPDGQPADLHPATAIAFLRRDPTSPAASDLTQAKLAAFLRRIHSCGHTPQWSAAGANHHHTRGRLSADQAACRACACSPAGHPGHPQPRTCAAAEIIERLGVHADQQVFISCPGPATAGALPRC
jgi:hypothetical protein